MKNNKIYPDINNCTVAVIGLGYVGLPLAIELSKKQKCHLSSKYLKRKIIGFDINKERLEELKIGFDRTNEISKKALLETNFHYLTNEISSIAIADVFIITVPTPIDDFKKPDLRSIKQASISVAKALKLRIKYKKKTVPIVIYESTVYPGTTEEICIPILEKESELKCNSLHDYNSFVCGYSPERINPGDKKHSIRDVVKVTSGSNPNAAKWIDNFYGSIIKAGTFPTKDIKTAEAAKIIENTQRDINIALVNELAIIFNLLNIDTLDVLQAASTKWNFLSFKPGLVGGHCIGVDPYYLTYKAQSVGYSPEILIAGRKLNDSMSIWVADQLILEMSKRKIPIINSRVLILGFTFKENCNDIRNTKVYEIIKMLEKHNLNVDTIDPWVDSKETKNVYKINISNNLKTKKKYNAIICTLAHKEFVKLKKYEWEKMIYQDGIIFDLKGIVPKSLNPIRI